jgi:hypothetical protein
MFVRGGLGNIRNIPALSPSVRVYRSLGEFLARGEGHSAPLHLSVLTHSHATGPPLCVPERLRSSGFCRLFVIVRTKLNY